MADQSIVIRWPLWARLLSMFASLLIGGVAAAMVLLGVAIVANGSPLGLFIGVCGVFILLLFLYVLRDTRAKVGWRIEIGADWLRLDLPRARSLIHRLRPVHARIDFAEIEVIEARLEAFPTWGMVIMQQIFAVKLKAGDLIILGEDRALATGLASSVLARAVSEIVQASGVEVRNLGMVQGRGGILAVWFASAPPWETPSLSLERQKELWRAARMTGALAAWVPVGARD